MCLKYILLTFSLVCIVPIVFIFARRLSMSPAALINAFLTFYPVTLGKGNDIFYGYLPLNLPHRVQNAKYLKQTIIKVIHFTL